MRVAHWLINAVGTALVLLVITSAAYAGQVIVAIGTSFTEGHGLPNPSTGSYPAQLEALLRQRGFDVRVVNAGIYKDTAMGGASRVGSAVPDGTTLAIVEFGTNEMRGFSGSPAEVRPGLVAISNNLKSRGIKAIYVQRFGVNAAGLGGSTISFPGLENPNFALAGDRVGHRNEAGYALVASRLAPAVSGYLRK